jgi:cation diffusion facilitator family transporter
MFGVEIVAGYLAKSTALTADSLDMLGDTLAYGVSLYVLGKGARLNAQAALFKGALMTLFGLSVLAHAVFRILNPTLPVAEAVGGIGILALAANLFCLVLLWKSRDDDLNMRSVWLCSRNDILVNLGVLASAVAVHFTQSRWPDIGVGVIVAVLVLSSSWGVLCRAYSQIRSTSF